MTHRARDADIDVVALDVSDLEPPEPMERILERVKSLPPNQVLKVSHRREPFPLYSILDQAGFGHCCVALDTGTYRIYIWLASGPVTDSFCLADAATEIR